jgi:predicted lipoprotein with Yx(FWY)xxD motif
MASRPTGKFRAAGVAALATSAVVLAACGSASSSSTSSAAAAPAAASSSSSSTSTTSAAAATGVAVGTVKGSSGTYLTGASGRALYLWVADSGGKSSCNGACAQVWHPLITKGMPTASGGANAADLGTVTRSDGSKQVTYKGHPLYYFVADTAAGSLKGQGSNNFGAKWWLVAPSGTAITAAASSGGGSSGGSTSTSSGSSSGGGWG